MRIESGILPAIQTAKATINKIVGRNITIRKGDAAVMLSPHRINQGAVDVRGIHAYQSTVAAQIDGGFYDKKGGVNNLGTFSSNSIIANFNTVRGGMGAQIKTKDIVFYPCSLQRILYPNRANNIDAESTVNTSLAVARYGAAPSNNCSGTGANPRGCYSVDLRLPNASNVTGMAVKRMAVSRWRDQKVCP